MSQDFDIEEVDTEGKEVEEVDEEVDGNSLLSHNHSLINII